MTDYKWVTMGYKLVNGRFKYYREEVSPKCSETKWDTKEHDADLDEVVSFNTVEELFADLDS